MEQYIKAFVEYFPDFIKYFREQKRKSWAFISFFEKNIIKYIIKSKNYDLLSHHNLKNHMKKINNMDFFLKTLNYINDDKDSSINLLEIIKKLFTQIKDDNYLFIELLKNTIDNQYIFDYLFNSISKLKDKNFFEKNKKIIIISLYIYSSQNKYYYLSKLLNYLQLFLSFDEIKNIIYPQNNAGKNINTHFLENDFIKINKQNKKVQEFNYYFLILE